MPELPEVETVVRALREPLNGRIITGVDNDWPRQIVTPRFSELQTRIKGQQILGVERRGKYILMPLSKQDTLIIHLKMSGHLAVVDSTVPVHKFVHTRFHLDNGKELRFRDMRKFGRVYLVNDVDDVVGHLGPEPLQDGFTVEVLADRLNGRTRQLKPLLLDQTFIAGVGNIYADEALFYAKLHPKRTANSLTQAEIARLYDGIRRALALGIEREGASISLYVKPDGTKGDMQNAVNVFRRTHQPCYDCGTPIERIKLNGRSTHFCPHCQK